MIVLPIHFYTKQIIFLEMKLSQFIKNLLILQGKYHILIII